MVGTVAEREGGWCGVSSGGWNGDWVGGYGGVSGGGWNDAWVGGFGAAGAVAKAMLRVVARAMAGALAGTEPVATAGGH